VSRGNSVDGSAVRLHESQCAVIGSFDANAAFVNGAVVEAAERHEVGRFGFAAIGPVLDVMCIDITRVRAAGEAAAFVASIQEAAKRGRNWFVSYALH
jgi:hypothetical protein